AVGQRVEPLLTSVTRSAPMTGPEDESWYWAAPLLLDLAQDARAARAWIGRDDLAEVWSGAEEEEGTAAGRWREHIERARELMRGGLSFGRPPRDLARVVALLAIGGPSTAALRTFGRIAGTENLLFDARVRD